MGGLPRIRLMVFWGLYWRFPVYGNYQLESFVRTAAFQKQNCNAQYIHIYIYTERERERPKFQNKVSVVPSVGNSQMALNQFLVQLCRRWLKGFWRFGVSKLGHVFFRISTSKLQRKYRKIQCSIQDKRFNNGGFKGFSLVPRRKGNRIFYPKTLSVNVTVAAKTC